MKKMTTKLVLAGILLSSAVSAQQITVAPALKSNYVMSGNAVTQAKSTAVQSRVVGYAYSDYSNGFSYSLQDTAFLTYSDDRGHDSLMNEIKYDVSVSQYVVANVLVNDTKSTQTFDTEDNILTNLQQDWNTGTSTWDNDENTVYTYDGDNNMLTSVNQDWDMGGNVWENDVKHIYTYDGNNNMLTDVTQYWDNMMLTWENSYQYIYSYDVDNNKTVQIEQYWDGMTSTWVNNVRHAYVYDVNGDMTTHLFQYWNSGTSDWDNSYQNIYTYDTDHLMLTDVRQNDVVGVWQNSTRTTYSYTGTDATTMVYQNWNVGTSSWNNDTRELRTYNGNHMVITTVLQSWNNGTSSFDNQQRMHYAYNSFNQPTVMYNDTWNAGIWQVTTSDGKLVYYYEEYGAPEPETVAGIANISNFNLYPVPAQNFVRVEMTWSTPEAFTVSVTDMQGRLVTTYSEKATANYARSIDVNQLAAGNYVIKIATANGKATYQQFSVMH